MDTLLQKEKEEKGVNKILLAAIGIAVLIVAAIIGLWSLLPTAEKQKREVLEGAVREGSPEFEALTRKIVIINDAQNTMESPTGLGTITMFIRGSIRNISTDKIFTAIEIKVSVLDPKDKVIKEKTTIVIPAQRESLAPKEVMEINVPIEGFAKDDDRARVQWKVTAIKVEK
jgi:hypothetical protein